MIMVQTQALRHQLPNQAFMRKKLRIIRDRKLSLQWHLYLLEDLYQASVIL